jgi:hypothetical protein
MKNYLPEHLQIAHHLWKKLLLPSDNAIDATCGNGHDSFVLASLLPKGILFCYDIQKKAIENTKALLKEHSIGSNNIFFIQSSHESFLEVPSSLSIKLITYNLGYLPGGDKSITTKKKSTINSIDQATKIISQSGALSITCYSGHPEGKIEEEAVYSFLDQLDKRKFTVTIHNWPKEKAPSFIWIVKNF